MRQSCRHFNGIQHDTCEVGIAYAAVREKPPGQPYMFPCLMTGGHCAKFTRFTDEENKSWNAEIKARMLAVGVARAAIVAHDRDAGDIDCPVCEKGRLRYSKARSNGHIHASCTTSGCVRWME